MEIKLAKILKHLLKFKNVGSYIFSLNNNLNDLSFRSNTFAISLSSQIILNNKEQCL